MRGALIFSFFAELHRLDAARMATEDPDGAGPLTSGYDPDFREPVLLDRNDDGVAEPFRLELPAVRIPVQVDPEAMELMRMTASGDAPRQQLDLVMHFRDLEGLGLVDAETGDALIRTGDRLGALYDRRGQLVQAIRTPPGLYVSRIRESGFGLGRAHPRRNLLLVSFQDRPQARNVA